MKLKEGFVFRKIAGDNVIVPIGEQIQRFNGLIKVNDSAAFLWNLLKEEITQEKLIDKLIEEYQIDSSLATSDVENFINILKQNDMIEE
ncbi:MAG: PqqD family protein [Intestinibacter sp.]|uniref:PqqD family protein n=1 Tax=Intestinibacter sp. TaxID=1965304 RepID=UPI003F17112B